MLNNKKIERGTNRSFGLVFFIAFLIIGLWPLAHDGSVRFWSLIIASIFLFLGILNSKNTIFGVCLVYKWEGLNFYIL